MNFTPRSVAQEMRKGGLFGNPPQNGGVHKRPRTHERAIVIDAKGDAPGVRFERVCAVQNIGMVGSRREATQWL